VFQTTSVRFDSFGSAGVMSMQSVRLLTGTGPIWTGVVFVAAGTAGWFCFRSTECRPSSVDRHCLDLDTRQRTLAPQLQFRACFRGFPAGPCQIRARSIWRGGAMGGSGVLR